MRPEWSLLVVLLPAVGCGLVLDLDPDERRGRGDGGSLDATRADVPSIDSPTTDPIALDARRDAIGGDATLIDATDPTGGPCESDLDCDGDLLCFYFITPRGVCTPLCPSLSDDECVGAGSSCWLVLGQCSPACDPRTGEGCFGLACDFFDTSDVGDDATYCREVGTAAQGAPCEFASSFDSLTCTLDTWCTPYPPGGDPHCMQKCRVDEPTDCSADRSCWSFMGPGMFLGGIEWGVCGPP